MNISNINPGKTGIEHVRKFNNKMEVTMKDVVKGERSPRTIKDDIEATYVGPKCPHCDISTQYHDGAETCPVHGKVLIDA